MKRITSSIVILIFLSVSIRIIYASTQPQIRLTADSYEYLNLANNIAKNPSVKLVINPYRPPLYSALILLSLQFRNSMSMLMLFQSVIAVMAIIYFYQTLHSLKFTQKFSFFISLFISLNMMFIPWERTLLTESIAISWMIFFASVYLRTFAKPTFQSVTILLLVSIIGFYVRPAFLFVPALGFILLVYYQRKKFIFIVALIVYLLAPMIHTSLNGSNWQYNGLYVIGEFNLLGRILQFNLPIKSAKSVPYFYEGMTAYRALNGEPNPYRFLDYLDRDIYIKMDKLEELREFNRLVITNNLPAYTLRALLDIPKEFVDISPAVRQQDPSIFSILARVQRAIQIVMIFLFPIALIPIKRAPLASIALIYLLVIVFISYEDFGRLAVPIMPIVYLLTGELLYSIYRNLIVRKD